MGGLVTNDSDSGHPDNEREAGSLFATTDPGVVQEDFRVTPAGAGGFENVVQALARKFEWLARLPGQHNVVMEISTGNRNYYVQCIVDEVDGLWMEAVSNAYIATPPDQLDDERMNMLAELGFAAPDDTCTNFNLHLPRPVDWPNAAALLVDTLRTVYRASLDDELTLRIYPHLRAR
jgi:hypothetical protein